MRGVTLVILDLLRIKCHIRKPLATKILFFFIQVCTVYDIFNKHRDEC